MTNVYEIRYAYAHTHMLQYKFITNVHKYLQTYGCVRVFHVKQKYLELNG